MSTLILLTQGRSLDYVSHYWLGNLLLINTGFQCSKNSWRKGSIKKGNRFSLKPEIFVRTPFDKTKTFHHEKHAHLPRLTLLSLSKGESVNHNQNVVVFNCGRKQNYKNTKTNSLNKWKHPIHPIIFFTASNIKMLSQCICSKRDQQRSLSHRSWVFCCFSSVIHYLFTT